MTTPSPNRRDGRGRFAHGNAGGPGNPAGGQSERLRHALMAAVTPDDIAAALIAQAKTGDVAAVRELLNRTLGRPTDADTLARLERLEAVLLDPVAGRLRMSIARRLNALERLLSETGGEGVCSACRAPVR